MVCFLYSLSSEYRLKKFYIVTQCDETTNSQIYGAILYVRFLGISSLNCGRVTCVGRKIQIRVFSTQMLVIYMIISCQLFITSIKQKRPTQYDEKNYKLLIKLYIHVFINHVFSIFLITASLVLQSKHTSICCFNLYGSLH